MADNAGRSKAVTKEKNKEEEEKLEKGIQHSSLPPWRPCALQLTFGLKDESVRRHTKHVAPSNETLAPSRVTEGRANESDIRGKEMLSHDL